MRPGFKKLLWGFGGVVLSVCFFGFSNDGGSFSDPAIFTNSQLPPFLSDTANWSDSVYNSLSLEEKIGQMFMVAAYPNKGDQDKQRVTNLIKNYHVGGIIFFQGTTQQVAELTKYYQSISKTPLLIAIDGEWGLAMRLSDGIQYPKEMTLGAISDEMLIYQMGRDIAKQLKHIGVHVNFAPDIDINNNARNPVINTRSFGELRANVARKGILYMKGMQDEGVLAFAKHFPGHGDTYIDSHKGLPVIEFSPERLDSVELYPFRALINAGVAGVMIAHMNVLSLDTTRGLPSTLSPIIIDSLLQQKMAFKGLVVTDAMNMKGLSSTFQPVDANLRAIKAGNNIILMPEDVENTVPAVLQAIDSCLIDKAYIETSCRKIIHAKEWAFKRAVHQKYSADSLNKPDYLLTRQKLIEASLTVAKDPEKILPLKRLDTLTIAQVKIGNSDGKDFSKVLGQYTSVKCFDLGNEPDSIRIASVFDSLKCFNLVIVSMHSNSIFAAKNFDVSDTQTKLADSIMNCFPSVFCGFVNPYVLMRMKNIDSAKAIVMAFENDAITQRLTGQLLFGAIAADGKLPVSINEKLKAGCGIQTELLDRFKYVEPYEAGFDKTKLQLVDSIALKAIREKAMPGCQVFAAKDGKVFLNKSYGYQDYSTANPVENSCLYDLASLTKVTATLPVFMELDEKNLVKTTDKLSTFFPYLDSCKKGNIVLRDILLHQAGLVGWIPFYWSTVETVFPNQSLTSTKYSEDYPLQISPKLFLNKQIKFKDNYFADTYSESYPYHVAAGMYLRKDISDSIWIKIINSKLESPGHYKYSDLGFYILRKIVEQQSGQKLDIITKSDFYSTLGAYTLCFNPLSSFSINQIAPTENDIAFRRQVVHGYVHDPGAAMLGGVSGHAGLFGCANDVAKIMQMYLNGGHYGGIEYLNPKTVAKYTSCGASANGNRRGLGFDKPEPDINADGPTFKGISTKSFGHTGFTGTMVWADPDTGIVYVFLSNRVYPDATNNKLVKMDVRTNIQKAIYDARIKK
jgi:beta-N-acetylhexosaminidase